ncbi:PREDICTED: potassium voltage-gated channel subfamily E regulatory beta subunit 5 [Gekko japonicus]|uniref:Potassium voltage-gated channel subfamily E regulatory beta subunit 5 n=1 Tax=Gekko japonicus TaxID=146911 RepID=A0ABM1KB27_GEKJA|nr:PREDICTED: potassium voltage-gated channel subfamily E regulatory beta subunit 5 [Gekko japonicus]
MNCSESRRLQRLLGLLQELRGGGGPAPPNGSSWALDPTGGPTSPAAARRAGDDAYLYILLIMIFYGCLAGGLIVAYTRSKKLESKHDPYHLYIERRIPVPPGSHFVSLLRTKAAATESPRAEGDEAPSLPAGGSPCTSSGARLGATQQGG